MNYEDVDKVKKIATAIEELEGKITALEDETPIVSLMVGKNFGQRPVETISVSSDSEHSFAPQAREFMEKIKSSYHDRIEVLKSELAAL